MKYEILEWDTNFFGFKVGRINDAKLELEDLNKFIFQLRKKKVKLIYWLSDIEVHPNNNFEPNFFLSDIKTTLTINLEQKKSIQLINTEPVESFKQSMGIADLEYLAITSGEHSRFFKDPNFPRSKAIALYMTWIRNSLIKKPESDVLVIQNSKKIIGMITLGKKGNNGDIGLLAVDSNFRGMKYGEKLIYASQKWFVNNGFKYSQVVTQGNNTAALNLYKKCGYSVEKFKYLYHIWL